MNRKIEHWDEDEDDYMEKIPSRFQEVVRKPQQEQIQRPWVSGWD